MSRTETSTVFGVNYMHAATFAKAKSSTCMVLKTPPKAAWMGEIERTERKPWSSVPNRQTRRSRITPHQQYFVDGADFDFFVRFESTAGCMLDDMLARAKSVCLPGLSRPDQRVLDLLLVARVDCA